MADEDQEIERDPKNALASSPSLTATPAPVPAAARTRTQDVVSDAASFRDLMVSDALVRSLAVAGFERPSPVQKAAIPLGRVGTDLIVQAKSGTGKTVVFAVICLERVKPEQSDTQALILAPTREIAIQSEQVIRTLAAELPPPTVTSAVFVGGLPMVDDEKKLRRLCHVAVGTPGRVCALLQAERLLPGGLTLLVLDEADSLLGDSFYEDVTWVYDQLPKRKQVLAFSATYSPELLADLEPLMRRPHRVMMCSETVSLLGVKQFYALVPVEPAATCQCPVGGREGNEEPRAAAAAAAAPAIFRRKVQQLLRLLAGVSFHQAAVFCNHKPRAEWLAEQLNAAGYPAAYLSGDRAQTERMEAMAAVRGFKMRVVVSTDVMARGVDLERVNLVVNLDLPLDAATYMHRVGRTGRFGSRGVCVSYVTEEELALLVMYVDEQAAAAAAAAAAATTAAAANGGGGGGGGGAAVTRDGSAEADGGAAAATAGPDPAAAAAAAGPSGGSSAEEVLLPLPEVIPEDLYGYELGSDWERQALRQLLQKEQQARQLQSQQQQQAQTERGSSGEGPSVISDANAACVTEGDSSTMPAPAPLLELPPLPEEIKAARKAEKAALEAAKKAEKALRKQQQTEAAAQRQQTLQQQQQQQQELQAAWSAYGYGGYGNGWYGYGSDGYGGPQTTDAPTDTNGRSAESSSTSDPWAAYASAYARYYGPSAAAYGYHNGWQGYNHTAHGGAYVTYGSYPVYGDSYGSDPSAANSQEAAAAAWSRYYEEWAGGQGGSAGESGPGDGRGAWGAVAGVSGGSALGSSSAAAGASAATAPTAAPSTLYSRDLAGASAMAAPLWQKPRCPVASGSDMDPGLGSAHTMTHGSSGRAGPSKAPQPSRGSRQGAGGAVEGEDREQAGSDVDSELSFGALSGQPVPAGRGADIPAVLRRGVGKGHPSMETRGDAAADAAAERQLAGMQQAGANSSGTMAEARADEEVAEEADEGTAEGAEEGELDEEEDESWVLGDEDYSSEAARVVDNLIVLLPPEAGQAGKSAAGAAAPAAAAEQRLGSTRAEQQPAPLTSAAAAAAQAQGGAAPAAGPQAHRAPCEGEGEGAATWPGAYYGSWYDQHWLQGGQGASLAYGYNPDWQQGGYGDAYGGGGSGSQGWSYGSYSRGSQEAQQYPSVAAAQSHVQAPPPTPPPPPGPPHHHPYPPGPQPWYPHSYHHHPSHHYPPPHDHHHHHHHRHRHPPPPSPYAPSHGAYGHAAYGHYPSYSQQRSDWSAYSLAPVTDDPLTRPPRCGECLQRMLREYVRQQYTWQQAYAAWCEQYRRWYDEWLAGEAGPAPPSAVPPGSAPGPASRGGYHGVTPAV